MARRTPGPPGQVAPHAALDRGTDLARIGGLADALFAIVLTLLVLELRLPRPSYTTNAGLVAAYVSLLPVLYAYALTFAVGSLHWIAHHRVVALLTHYDRGLMVWNLILLGTVSGLPFSSAVIGSNGRLFAAWALYAANMVLIGLAQAALIGHAIRNGLLRHDIAGPTARFLGLRALAVPLVFLASIPVAGLSITAAKLTPALLFVYNAVLNARYRGTATPGR